MSKYIRSNIRHFASLLVLALIIAILISSLYLALSIVNDLPRGDSWRWTEKLLIPLSKGEISFRQYLMADYSPLGHNSFFTLALHWVDYRYFGINFILENTIGLFFYLITPVIFYLSLSGLDAIPRWERISWLFVICLVLFYPAVDFTWNIVVLEYFYLFLAFLLLFATEQYLLQNISLPLFVLTGVAAYTLGDVSGLLAGMATLCISIILFFTHRDLRKRLMLVWLIFILVQASLILLDTDFKPFHHGGNKPGSLLYLAQHPRIFVDAFVTGFSQAFINRRLFLELSQSTNIQHLQLIGVVVLTIGLVLCLLWFYSDKRCLFPLFLVAFAVLAVLGAIITRVPAFGVKQMYSPRYIRFFSPYLIGIILLAVCNYQHLRNWRHALLAFLAVLLFINYQLAAIYQYRRLPQLQGINHHFEQNIRRNSAYVTNAAPYCRDHDCISAWEFLNENSLSVFRGD